ncbi:MAG: FHA domain-containing protein [Propionibacteriaceae bacterium]|nr:FHA domain-containing protein [Propionibacteriaceae bacterium]
MLGANGPEPAAGHQASRLGDHDDLTVMGEGSIEPAPLPPPTPIGGGQVLARVCAQGHPNPPERATCRVCDIDLAGAPQQIPQPIVGRAVLASREVIELDRPVVFGREPQSKRGTTDGATARLVALAGNHISRNQVRLSPEGWQVYAVELRSKNGTLLHRFGEAPMRLPERPLLLKNHDVLDLGHGVLITLEGLP